MLTMSVKILCCAILLNFLLVLSVNAACVCQEKGVDYCAKCTGPPTIVRPKPRPPAYINAELSLKPIGDTCSCNKIFVEPAPLPKPCNQIPPKPIPPCKCAPVPTNCVPPAPLPPPIPVPPKLPACGCAAAPAYPTYPLPAAAYAPLPPPPPPSDNAIPADPISIGLALQATKAVAVPEAKLAYGFAKLPIDSMKKITFSNVPEENLYKLKSEVITFKKPTLAPPPPEEEEEELYDEEPVDAAAPPPPTLTYSQLGYVTEKFKNPKFRKLVACAKEYSAPEAYALPDKVAVDCGFQPGRIAAYIKLNPKADPIYY